MLSEWIDGLKCSQSVGIFHVITRQKLDGKSVSVDINTANVL